MIYKRNNKFYVKLSNPQGIKKALPAYSSKRASLQFENKLKQLTELQSVNEPLTHELNRWIETLAPEVKERLAKAGFLSDSKINSSRALSELIKDYQVYLKDKGRAKDYYNQAYNQCKKIIEGNKFKVITDISADKLDKWLSGKRNNENMSYRTSNGYLVAFKSFCNWLVNTNKITNNPVKSLKKLNEKEDRRLIRRTLSEDEFSAFLKAARDGGRFKGISGHEWYLLFLTAGQTGYRWSELKSLTRACIDFDSMTITIKAKNTKNRKDNTIPLRVELAELLYEHCRNMLPQANLFKLPYRNCGGQAVKFYLSATGSPEKGIAPIPYEDEGGRVFDFHSLRAQFGTSLAKAGVSLAQAQKLMRHSTPELTANHYSLFSIEDNQTAINKLSMPDMSDEKEEKKTGTCDSETGENNCNPICNPAMQNNPKNTEKTGNYVSQKQAIVENSKQAITHEKSPESTSQGLSNLVPPRGFEPRTPRLRICNTKAISGIQNNIVTKEAKATCNPICNPHVQKPPDLPPDLQEIVEQWKDLPESLKAGIMAMVKSAKKEN